LNSKNIAFHIGSANLGGTENHIIRIASRLQSSGYNVFLIMDSFEGELLEKIKKMEVKIFCNRMQKIKILRLVWIIKTYRFLVKNDIEVLNVYNDISIFYFGIIASLIKNIRMVISIRHNGFGFYSGGVKLKLISMVCRFLSDYIIVNSHNAKKNLIKYYHIDKNRINVIHNGIDKKLIYPNNDNIQLHELLNTTLTTINENTITIGQISRLHNLKDIDTIIKAAEKLVDENLIFLIIGDGSEKNRLNALIKSLNLIDKVILLGSQTNAISWIRNFDISLLSSYSEGMPNAILEYMICNKPVIASKVGGVPEIINHGETGLLFEPGNVEELVESILRLIKDNLFMEYLGNNGRRYVEKHFTLDREFNDHLLIYEKVFT